VFLSVCLSVCMQNMSNSYEWILMKFFRQVERGRGRNGSAIGADEDSFVDPGSLSRILRC